MNDNQEKRLKSMFRSIDNLVAARRLISI